MILKEKIEHIAKLARIELTEEEREKFTKELSLVLDYIKQLNEVDTSKVKGISQVTGLENITREDVVYKTQDIKDKLLKEAPKRKEDYIRVPKVLE